MKKFTCTLIVAAILATALSLCAFAEEYSNMELEDAGQQHWVIEGKTSVPPIADGVVEDGEYTLEVKDMNPANDAEDNRFFCIDPATLDVENFNLYFSYDDDYVYIGAEVTEREILDGEYICFYLSCNEKDFLDGVYVRYVFGGFPESDEAYAFETSTIGNTIVYELVIGRTALADYIGVEPEDITVFSILLMMRDDRDVENYPNDYPEIWFGTILPREHEALATSADAAEVEGKLWGKGADGRRFPHVMTFGEAPETEEPYTETGGEDVIPAETDPRETVLDSSNNEISSDNVAADKGCGSSLSAAFVSMIIAISTFATFTKIKKND